MLELELLDAGLVRSYGRALDANRVFLDSFSGIDRDLIVCLVTVFQALPISTGQAAWKQLTYQVVVFQINVQISGCSQTRFG